MDKLQFDLDRYQESLVKETHKSKDVEWDYTVKVISSLAISILYTGIGIALFPGVLFAATELTGNLAAVAFGVACIAFIVFVIYVVKSYKLPDVIDDYLALSDLFAQEKPWIDIEKKVHDENLEEKEGAQFRMLADMLQKDGPIHALNFKTETGEKIHFKDCPADAKTFFMNVAELMNDQVKELNLSQVIMSKRQFSLFLKQFLAEVPLKKLVLPEFVALDEEDVFQKFQGILLANPQLEVLATPRSLDTPLSANLNERLNQLWLERRNQGQIRLRDLRLGEYHQEIYYGLYWWSMEKFNENFEAHGAFLHNVRPTIESFLPVLEAVSDQVKFLTLPDPVLPEESSPDVLVEPFRRFLRSKEEIEEVEGNETYHFSEQSKRRLKRSCKQHPNIKQLKWGDFLFVKNNPLV